MKEESILKHLSLPKSTWTLRTFPLNKLEKEMTLAQRNLFHEIVESRGIRVLATINQMNSNILKYEDEYVRYEEIIIFLIKVKVFNKNKDIYNVLARKMPYPLIIFFEKDEEYKIAVSEHEKGEGFLLRPISIFLTEKNIDLQTILDNTNFEKLQKENLQQFYQNVLNQLMQIQAKSRYEVQTPDLSIEVLEYLERLDKQIEQLIREAKKEKQMNKRIALQIKATKLKEEKKQILNRGINNEESTE